MKVGSICNDSRRWNAVNDEADVERLVGACGLSCNEADRLLNSLFGSK